MSLYLDSSALVKLYCNEIDSEKVINLLKNEPPPLSINYLHELEVQNALRLKVFRKEWSKAQLKVALKLFRSDINSGVIEILRSDFSSIFYEATKLSATFTASKGVRTIDILHIASAKNIKAKLFLTFDSRQAKMAKAAGLLVY